MEVNNILQEWLFQDRTDAAKHLARRLESIKRQEEVQKEEDKEDAYNKSYYFSYSRWRRSYWRYYCPELGFKLDIVVSRKSGTPFNPEFAIGAVMPEDSYFLMILNEVADTINIPQDILILKLVNKQKK